MLFYISYFQLNYEAKRTRTKVKRKEKKGKRFKKIINDNNKRSAKSVYS